MSNLRFCRRFAATAALMVLLALSGCGTDESDITPPGLTINGGSPVTTVRARDLSGTMEIGATVEVTVNTGATVSNLQTADGSWSCSLDLMDGPNLVTVSATDAAENRTTLSFVLTYDALSIESYVTPIADPLSGERIGGLLDPSLGEVPSVRIGDAAENAATVGGDTWYYDLADLPAASNAVTVSLAHPDPDIGLVEKTVAIGVNDAAPVITVEQPQGEVPIPSQVVRGSVDPAVEEVTVLPLPSTGPTVTAGSWSATLNRLGSGKNIIAASATLDGVTATARSLLRYDSEVPLLREVVPVNGAVPAEIPTEVTAEFATAMAPDTIGAASFTLSDGIGQVQATVSYDADTLTATLAPNDPLAAGTTYTATLDTAITDTDGVPLASTLTWSFTTPAGL